MTVEVEHVVEVAMAVGKSVVSVPLKVEVAAAVSVVVVERLSEKASPSGMLISGMSEAAGALVTVGRQVEVPVSAALVEAVATNVLESLSPSFLLEFWSSVVLSPLIPPVAPVSAIKALASSGFVHEMV